jgi:integrase
MSYRTDLKPILKGGTRILRPCEYEMLRRGAMLRDNLINLDTLLLTGLRYIEAVRLKKHPEWFDGEFIHLPTIAQKKAKRRQKERWVRLNPQGQHVLPFFFKAKPLPMWQTWTKNLRKWGERAGLDPVGLGPKTTRKTWESWLTATYPNRLVEIVLSQGHTEVTSLKFYLNLPFTKVDKIEMKKWVAGWI